MLIKKCQGLSVRRTFADELPGWPDFLHGAGACARLG